MTTTTTIKCSHENIVEHGNGRVECTGCSKVWK
jgi:hypothetical protein